MPWPYSVIDAAPALPVQGTILRGDQTSLSLTQYVEPVDWHHPGDEAEADGDARSDREPQSLAPALLQRVVYQLPTWPTEKSDIDPALDEVDSDEVTEEGRFAEEPLQLTVLNSLPSILPLLPMMTTPIGCRWDRRQKVPRAIDAIKPMKIWGLSRTRLSLRVEQKRWMASRQPPGHTLTANVGARVGIRFGRSIAARCEAALAVSPDCDSSRRADRRRLHSGQST